MKLSLKQLAEHVGGRIKGDEGCQIESVATLKNAGPGDISFLTNMKYKAELQSTNASAVILNDKHAGDCPTNAIIVDNPHPAYAKIATLLYRTDNIQVGIHHSAIVSDSAVVNQDAFIGPNCVVGDDVLIDAGVIVGAGCYIGNNAKIGRDSHLVANVVILDRVKLGERVLLHPGVVIGADGFGQAFDNGKWIKVPQVGSVLIGDETEIGANTTIDRGAIEDTIIGDGVKLDNLIQVGHNVIIGENTVIAACTAIAGSTTIGNNCLIGGTVAIAGHIAIADNVTITGRSTVLQSVKEAGVYSSSTPLEPNKQWHKNHIRFKQLDEMARRLNALEKELDKLRG